MPAKKKFTFNLPDEPLIQTRNKNLTVDLVYKGARYHIFSVDNATKNLMIISAGAGKYKLGDINPITVTGVSGTTANASNVDNVKDTGIWDQYSKGLNGLSEMIQKRIDVKNTAVSNATNRVLVDAGFERTVKIRPTIEILLCGFEQMC